MLDIVDVVYDTKPYQRIFDLKTPAEMRRFVLSELARSLGVEMRR